METYGSARSRPALDLKTAPNTTHPLLHARNPVMHLFNGDPIFPHSAAVVTNGKGQLFLVAAKVHNDGFAPAVFYCVHHSLSDCHEDFIRRAGAHLKMGHVMLYPDRASAIPR